MQLIGHIAENGCSLLIVAHYSPQLHRYRIERTYHSVLSVGLRCLGGSLVAVIFDDGAKPLRGPR